MVKIVWRKLALLQLKEAFDYIKKDSLQSAENVRNAIFSATDNLKYNPEIYPLDKYRKNNDGTFRAFEIYSYRIAYQITKLEYFVFGIQNKSL
ncbi:type II toxin-antitoxin system RelE/ParE family toxin [Winogradskyella wichelsiae]|uniref:type II toxin-antitoxin system RelE/ParE family toxin n=1 Tax=Winogradskyella wichelsiae TaxID=2697007 RepID=UPI0015C9DE59|nr:type II toxin-antitoxin system RelE/ParE family toxin [Winogradskyella wichelsiae]